MQRNFYVHRMIMTFYNIELQSTNHSNNSWNRFAITFNDSTASWSYILYTHCVPKNETVVNLEYLVQLLSLLQWCEVVTYIRTFKTIRVSHGGFHCNRPTPFGAGLFEVYFTSIQWCQKASFPSQLFESKQSTYRDTHSLTAALDQLRVVASSTHRDKDS